MDMRCGFNVSQGEPGRIQENISNVFPAQRWLVKVLFGPTSSMRWHVQQRMDMAPSCHSGAMNYLWWKELLELYVQHRQKQVGFSELGSPFAAAQTFSSCKGRKLHPGRSTIPQLSCKQCQCEIYSPIIYNVMAGLKKMRRIDQNKFAMSRRRSQCDCYQLAL